MKKTLLISILFFSLSTYGQNNNTIDYSAVDNYVLGLKKETLTIQELSKKLTSNFKTDEEKVRAIFSWMTNNISYDCKTYHNNGKIKELHAKDFYRLREYYYAYADHVLKTKKGICGGYALLFYHLCKSAGLQCYLVNGITSNRPKTVQFFRTIGMFNTSHQWNKVKIGENWYYIDVTWASGTCNFPVTKFRKDLNLNYYLTPENLPFATHAEEKTESADFNDVIDNTGYPNHTGRRHCLNIFYCTDW